MSQFDYIKNIAKFGLENDQEKLLLELNQLIEYSRKTKKLNFAIQLQSILKESFKFNSSDRLAKVPNHTYYNRIDDKEVNELILDKLTSDYRFSNLVNNPEILNELKYFVNEHKEIELLNRFELPVSNKILLYGPSGCGKTLASYVIAGELGKMMVVVNLGAIVSSKLGETSKNLAKIFRKAASEDCIIFIDEFDSIGKIRDYNQDHGEMKRVVNTILQIFDYLPQSSMVIAATNQKDILDNALLRRFDFSIEFDLPNEKNIIELIELTLNKGSFKFDKASLVPKIIKESLGLSYYSIQKTLITAIKRSLFKDLEKSKQSTFSIINTTVWLELIINEKKALIKKSD